MKIPELTDGQLKVMGWVLGTIAMGIIAYLVLKKFGFIGASKDPASKTVDDINVNASNLSFSTTDLDSKTDLLYQAMDRFGTDEDTIMEVFDSLRTKDDLLYIIKSFGVRKYFLTGHGLLLGDDINLIGWLKNEVSDYYITEIQTIFTKLGVDML